VRDDPVRREELDAADRAEAATLAGIVPALGVGAAAATEAGGAATEADASFAGAIPHTSQ
jgi:hypothetical protein